MSKLTLNELSASLNDFMDGKQDCQSYSLNTENKTIVGAINEIYGKEIIANAIGEPLDRNDTFTEMSNDINNLLSTFKINMMNSGVAVESGDKFKQLIDKIKGLTEGEGNKGIQYAEGSVGGYSSNTNIFSGYTIEANFGFTPTILFVQLANFYYNSTNKYSNILVSNISSLYNDNHGDMLWIDSFDDTYFTLKTPTSSNITAKGVVKWYAIGIGEEDTTLRDSLADILKSNGVDVSDEDNMADLIGKVDGIPKVTQVVASDNMLMNIQQGKSQRTFGYQDTIARFTCLFEGSIRAFVNARVNQSYTDIMYFELFRDGVIIETGWANVPAHTTTGSNLYYDFNDIKLGDEIQIRFKSTISTNVVYVLVPGLRGDIVK